MKNRLLNSISYIIFSLIIFAASNFYVLKENISYFWIFIILYILINFFPVLVLPKTKRLKRCAKGNGLLIEFLGSTALSVIVFILSNDHNRRHDK